MTCNMKRAKKRKIIKMPVNNNASNQNSEENFIKQKKCRPSRIQKWSDSEAWSLKWAPFIKKFKEFRKKLKIDKELKNLENIQNKKVYDTIQNNFETKVYNRSHEMDIDFAKQTEIEAAALYGGMTASWLEKLKKTNNWKNLKNLIETETQEELNLKIKFQKTLWASENSSSLFKQWLTSQYSQDPTDLKEFFSPLDRFITVSIIKGRTAWLPSHYRGLLKQFKVLKEKGLNGKIALKKLQLRRLKRFANIYVPKEDIETPIQIALKEFGQTKNLPIGKDGLLFRDMVGTDEDKQKRYDYRKGLYVKEKEEKTKQESAIEFEKLRAQLFRQKLEFLNPMTTIYDWYTKNTLEMLKHTLWFTQRRIGKEKISGADLFLALFYQKRYMCSYLKPYGITYDKVKSLYLKRFEQFYPDSKLALSDLKKPSIARLFWLFGRRVEDGLAMPFLPHRIRLELAVTYRRIKRKLFKKSPVPSQDKIIQREKGTCLLSCMEKEVQDILDKIPKYAMTRKTPVINLELFFLTFLEEPGEFSEFAKKLLRTKTNYLELRYRLENVLLGDATTFQEEIPPDLQHFTFLLKTGITEGAFQILMKDPDKLLAIRAFRRRLINGIERINFSKFLETYILSNPLVKMHPSDDLDHLDYQRREVYLKVLQESVSEIEQKKFIESQAEELTSLTGETKVFKKLQQMGLKVKNFVQGGTKYLYKQMKRMKGL